MNPACKYCMPWTPRFLQCGPRYNSLMLIFDTLAEQRIREAQDNGEFDNLPGVGAPLALDDDALVPEDLRAAYRLLRNSGFLPPELEAHGEMRRLEQMLAAVEAENEDGNEENEVEARRSALLARIRFLLSRRAAGERRSDLRVEAAYFEKTARALARSRQPG